MIIKHVIRAIASLPLRSRFDFLKRCAWMHSNSDVALSWKDVVQMEIKPILQSTSVTGALRRRAVTDELRKRICDFIREVYSDYPSIDDLEFSKYVKALMKKLYKLNPSYERINKDNTISLHYTRKPLILFKQRLGLPLGPKGDIEIPSWIMDNKEFKIACVRGIFATDGYLAFQKKYKTVNYYPQLKITSKSSKLIKQIYLIFTDFGIKCSISKDKIIYPRKPNVTWNVYIYGVHNLKKFVDILGFANPKHQRKYERWCGWRDLNTRQPRNPVS